MTMRRDRALYGNKVGQGMTVYGFALTKRR